MTMSKTTPSITAKKKKKRTSKHVLQARQEKEQQSGGGNTAVSRNGPASSSSSSATAGATDSGQSLAQGNNTINKGYKKKNRGHVAATYLSEWKSSSTTWKFQKNTQSWLIRHMYEANKVGKSTFTLLLDYLKGLEGHLTKERMKADATRRARRYKSWISSLSSHNDDKEEKKEDIKSEASEAMQSPSDIDNMKKAGTGKRKRDGADDNSNKNDNDDDDDDLRWSRLDDHDKRKEYKRARKVLELCNDIMK